MWMTDDGWGHMGDGSWSWGWGIFGMLMMAVFWGGILLLFFYAIRGSFGQRNDTPATGGGQQDRALTILQERYARGEIDRDEFEERRRTLDSPLHSS
jgi:putative membrane protein